jgi:RNA polymerase subunit RPABC4/transcription elongation factor Spt4
MGCDSIVASKVNICPNCHAYRFEIDADTVVAQAKALSTREQNSVVAEDLT